jgi:hypothetical protein
MRHQPKSSPLPPKLHRLLGLCAGTIGLAGCEAGNMDEFSLDPTSMEAGEEQATEGAIPAGSRGRSGGVPTGGIQISPSGSWVAQRAVQVELIQTGGLSATEQCVSLLPACRNWQPVGSPMTLSLARTSTAQTIRGWLRAADGSTSAVMSTTVRLDEQAPVAGTLMATPATGGADLSWSGFSDNISGIARYRVVGSPGTIAPRCTRAEYTLYEGTGSSTSIRGYGPTPIAIRLCAQDNAGTWSDGKVARFTPLSELNPPVVGAFVIASGATYVNQREVVLNSTVSDESGVATWCASETAISAAECTVWRDWAPAVSFELSGGTGTKSLKAWFKDPHGNVSASATDSVIFDRDDPENGQITGEDDEGVAALTWSGFTDELSGVVTYVVVRGDDAAPEDCASGSEVYRGSATTARIAGLAEIRHGFRVCAIDAAGNISSGDTVRVTIEPERIPPQITRFATSSGATQVCDRTNEMLVRASGDTEIVRVCITEGSTCSYWLPYEELVEYQLPNDYGPKTLSAWVRDANGTESVSPATFVVERIECASELALSATAVDQGPICGSEDSTFTLTNNGNIPMTVDGLSISGSAFTMTHDPLPWSIPAGGSHSLTLHGTPGSANLIIETDAPGANRVTVPLTAHQDQPPSLSFVAPTADAIFAVGAESTLQVQVSDPDEDPRELSVSFESNVDGDLGEVHPDGSGVASWIFAGVDQSPGDHTLSATVTDVCGQTASSTLGVCQDEGFTADNLDMTTWHFEGNGRWDGANGWVELTKALTGQGGTAFQTATTVGSGEIDIEFSFYMSGGTGADGITVTALDSTRMTSFLGGFGGGIGYAGLPGWTVEVDNWYNGGIDPTVEDHISVHLNGDVSNPRSWAALPDMEDGRWHTMRVQAIGAHFTASVDGVTYINTLIGGLTDFPAYVGFTAATGGATNLHLIDALEVRGTACPR